jgi:trk system potassium uptake protein TrkH
MEIGEMSGFCKGLVILSMLTGGCVGSTAGGMKMLRVLIVFQACRHMLIRTGLARHAVSSVHLGDHRLGDDEVRDSCLLMVLLVCAVLVSWLAFLVAGHAALDSLFEVSSALGTVGLSSGLSDRALHWSLKLVLCGDMLLGRLEILAWLVLFHPATWFGRRMETQ